MKIGVRCAAKGANAHYRAVLPVLALRERGHTVVWPPSPVEELLTCDVVHLHRQMGPQHVELIAQLRERGVAIVWDNDDDFSSLPKVTRKANGRSKRDTRKDFERSLEIARMADLMTTPSPVIADIYRAAGVRNVRVLENALSATETGLPRERHVGLVIGCTSGLEHRDDHRQMKLGSVIDAVLRDEPSVRVVSIGVPIETKSPTHTWHGQISINELIEREREFDIGIAPLIDSAFNRSRSNIKVKEYAAAGAMWLASPVGPYRELGEAQGGMLVGERDWFDALTAVVADYRRRLDLTTRARAWAAEQTVERIAGRWEAAFRAAIESARANGQAAGALR